MADNNGRLAIASSEGDIFKIIGGRYSGSTNIALILKSHSGDQYSCHRVGRASYSIDQPALTVCITLQPQVIQENSDNPAFRGQGLWARFLVSVDRPQAGYRQRSNKEVSFFTRENYNNQIKSLLALPNETVPRLLKLTEEAQRIWDEFYNETETSMQPGGFLENIKDFGSKQAGNVARIGGLLHYAEYGIEATNKDISAETIRNAVAIGRYYLAHAKAFYGLMEQDPQIESANKVLEYLVDKKPATFKACDVLSHKNHFKKVDDVKEALTLLIERHYIKEAPSEHKKGRYSAPIYTVNPKILSPIG